MPAPKLFISCVSSEFRSYRLKLANHLSALKDEPWQVKVQEDFQQGDTLLCHLAIYIRDCELVIHLVGEMAGWCPTPDHERTLLRHLGETDSTPLPGWSATQWEYHLARRFNKRVLVYIASPTARIDCGRPVTQSDEDAALQRKHIEQLNNAGEHFNGFDGHTPLLRQVFHDLGIGQDFKVSNLPYAPLGTLFKGREEFLQQIRETLGEVEHKGLTRVAAITATPAATVHGLGGIGKTRAAVEYAHRHADDYSALLFVRGDSPENFRSNIAALCGPMVLNLREKDEKELDVQFAAALRWLSSHPGWFLIIDNVDTEEAAKSVEEVIGKLADKGHVLITSRVSIWGGDIVPLALDVLALEDSTDFLLERTDRGRKKSPDDLRQAKELATLLGQLALALEQAGAMIVERGLSFTGYRKLWDEHHETVLSWYDERVMKYPKSVAVTWETSFAQLTDSARILLNRLAWFAPDPIPESLLQVPVPGDEERVKALGPRLPGGDLVELVRYSLATRDLESLTK